MLMVGHRAVHMLWVCFTMEADTSIPTPQLSLGRSLCQEVGTVTLGYSDQPTGPAHSVCSRYKSMYFTDTVDITRECDKVDSRELAKKMSTLGWDVFIVFCQSYKIASHSICASQPQMINSTINSSISRDVICFPKVSVKETRGRCYLQ